MADRVEYGLLRSTTELERIAPEWAMLWQQDDNATPFQSPEWLIPWWHHFGNADPRVVTIASNGELIGLVPFYLYKEPPPSGKRKLLLLGVGTTDYLDGVFAPECSPDHVKEAIRTLEDGDNWDALHITQLRRQSRLYQALSRSGDGGFEMAESMSCSRVPASRIPELPKKLRRSIKNALNRAQRQGRLEFLTANESGCVRVFESLRALHTERWQTDGMTGVLADQRMVSWHREAVPLLLSKRMLQLYSLFLDGEPIAVLYSLLDPERRRERTQYHYLGAFSVNHADLSPGTVLLAHTLDHAAQKGVTAIDLLRGEEEYKKLWHAEKFATWAFTASRSA